MRRSNPSTFTWRSTENIPSRPFVCGFCGHHVASSTGYHPNDANWYIYICTHCRKPSFFDDAGQHPGVAPGADVKSLPTDIEKLYLEARSSVAAGAPTSSVLASRKLLMHIAVSKGALTNQTFQAYVDYLAANNYVPPGGEGWVDHIRKKGNEANHEIVIMDEEHAKELIDFSEMLLKFIYEFPARIPAAKATP